VVGGGNYIEYQNLVDYIKVPFDLLILSLHGLPSFVFRKLAFSSGYPDPYITTFVRNSF
jgi:hypothetical protein